MVRFAFLLLALCVWPGLANAATIDGDGHVSLSQDEQRDLLAASCQLELQPSDKTADVGRRFTCTQPRNYPSHQNSDHTCSISLVEGRVWQGTFSEGKSYWLAVYQASCEPRSNANGGAVLYALESGQPVLLRWLPGAGLQDCAIIPVQELDVPFCISSFSGAGGQYNQIFGPVDVFDGSGSSQSVQPDYADISDRVDDTWQQAWLGISADPNDMDLLNAVCHTDDFMAGRLCGMYELRSVHRTKENDISLIVGYRDTPGAEAATLRQQSGSYTQDELERLAEIPPHSSGYPLMRAGEYVLCTAQLIYRAQHEGQQPIKVIPVRTNQEP